MYSYQTIVEQFILKIGTSLRAAFNYTINNLHWIATVSSSRASNTIRNFNKIISEIQCTLVRNIAQSSRHKVKGLLPSSWQNQPTMLQLSATVLVVHSGPVELILPLLNYKVSMQRLKNVLYSTEVNT